MKRSLASSTKATRDNASMKRVVFLKPEVKKVPAWTWSSAWHGRPLVFIIIAVLAITSIAFNVSGTSFDYYPETCLGSWKNPENAQGQPTLKTSLANLKMFSERNSAVFYGGTHSIICQSFKGQSIPDDATLSSLRLTFSLAVKHPLVPTVPVEIPVDEPVTTTSDDSEFTIVDEPVNEPSDNASGGGDAEQPVTEEPAEETPAEEVTPESETPVVDEPAEEPTPSEEDSSDEPSPEPEPEPTAFRFPFINKASAQESADVLATVLYSLDGDEWQALGHVTQTSDWKNILFHIPVGEGGVTSVADIPNLRIRLDAGFFGIDNPTEVYLDGMEIEINTDEYVSEEEMLGLEGLEGLPAFSGPKEVVVQTLSLARTVVPTEEVLPWQPLDFQIENEESSKDITRSVATEDSRTDDIIVSGSCKQGYYTVLVFADPDAYRTAPRAALFNSAYPCDNGLYSYRLTPETLKLKTGTYYLLVADQPLDGPWVPISAIMPFEIEEETVIQ